LALIAVLFNSNLLEMEGLNKMQQQPAATIITRNPVRKVNKAFYLWSYIGGIIATFILTIVAIVPIFFLWMSEGNSNIWGAIASIVGIVLVIVAIVIYIVVISCVLLYKAWKAIQDGHARTTPGKAVGFMFIPLFNFYWVFQAYWGFAKDYNAYLERYQLTSAKLPEGLFLANSILTVAVVVPYLGSLAEMAAMVLEGIVINEQCNAINRLAV
jgi:hypothetical protein